MKKCDVCEKTTGPFNLSPDICDNCLDAIKAEAAEEMGCSDYYEMTGELPGDR